ncbi:hypothetical protein RchiOBHm_Chr3g0483191 [Rosa chinensis]|uniref:Uncharacterized protein n=1 Tax=Rosa chinensis TaxID=74649 RepID=A0A2P6REE5_ROSCH|nr:hypothetical protein RchiOBHm_Chr3g0483191 [Rosa chinensis]
MGTRFQLLLFDLCMVRFYSKPEEDGTRSSGSLIQVARSEGSNPNSSDVVRSRDPRQEASFPANAGWDQRRALFLGWVCIDKRLNGVSDHSAKEFAFRWTSGLILMISSCRISCWVAPLKNKLVYFQCRIQFFCFVIVRICFAICVCITAWITGSKFMIRVI